MTNSAAPGGASSSCRGGDAHYGSATDPVAGGILLRIVLHIRRRILMHTGWHVHRTVRAQNDGPRRWDYAYQFLLQWAVHQMLLVDELTQRGCRVEFVERPMSDDPHDQLLLPIRSAVAEYERTLIAERMRRGRQAKLRSGQLLPWTRAPYGYLLDPDRPRDPSRVRIDPVQAAVVEQMFAWDTDPGQTPSLYQVAKRLSEAQIP